jgi:methylmalonyl-CoA mutase, N-terminal domain
VLFRSVQQVLANESGVTGSVDPLAGSFYVEHLTDSLIKKVDDYLEHIEKMGGALQAVKTGYFQHEIQKAAYEYQKMVEQKQKTVVGVNDFVVMSRFSMMF